IKDPLSKEGMPNSAAPRIALIGCGAIAESYYLPALARFPAVLEKLILVDCDLARAKQMAARFGARAIHPDYRSVTGDVDGAIIAASTHLHFPIADEFLSLGKPVLCEKPLAESAAQAEALVERARQTNAAFAANYLQRLIPSFAKVKEILASRALGEVRSIHYQVGEEFDWPTSSGFYFNSPLTARGVLRDRGAHVMDHICWWLEGKPEVIASQNDSYGGSEAVAFIRFTAGICWGTVKLSWLASFPCRYVVACEGGTITGDVYDYQGFFLKDGQDRAKRVQLHAKEKTKSSIALKVVENFIRVICNGERPLVSGCEALDSLRFIDECYAAAGRLEMPWYEIGEVQNGH
ncbi:MAG TPA: Gfo/Idh/MocA family oxidoreductase, partial [Anaerolineales bacterium]